MQVFNSILHFVDGIMVVKPDGKVFDAMVERYKRERLSSAWSGRKEVSVPASGASSVPAVSWQTPSKTMCWEKSYLFFLFWFGNIEAVRHTHTSTSGEQPCSAAQPCTPCRTDMK